MKLLLIARPVSKHLFCELNRIVKKISDSELPSSKAIVFLESADMGKKYITFYDKNKKEAYKLFCKVIPNNNLEKYVTYWSDEELDKFKDHKNERNEILSKFSDFQNAKISIFDKKSIFSNLFKAIKNAKLSKKEKNILKIPELKNLKKCLDKYDRIIRDINDLLKSSEESIKEILFKIDEITKNMKNFSQVIRDIDNLINEIEDYNMEFFIYDELIQMLFDLKEVIDEIPKNCIKIEKKMSKFDTSEISKEEQRILSEIGKFVEIENGLIEYSDQLFGIIDLDDLNSHNLEHILTNISNSIYDIINKYETYIIHKNIGWYQLCFNYIYRSFKLIPYLRISNEKYDVSGQYDILKKYLDAADNDTLPLILFAYMLFSTNRSFFSSSAKKFAINITNPYNMETNETLIKYISCLNMNFMSLAVDLKNNFPKDFSKEFKVPCNYINPFYLKKSKYKLQDFSVFLYDLNSKRKIRNLRIASNDKYQKTKKTKSKRIINSSILQKDIQSQISYIFLNLENEENVFLNIYTNAIIENNILQYNLPASSEEEFGFNNLIKDYRTHISQILSDEIIEKDKEYKSKIFEKINDEFFKSKTISKGISMFIEKLLEPYGRQRITIEFFLYLENLFRKLSLSKLEYIGIIFNKWENSNEQFRFIFRFKKEYNFRQKSNDSGELLLKNNDDIEEFREFIADIAVDRYHELLLNEYIYTKNYKPKYFNKLHSEAKKYLKDNLKGKKYDSIQFSHCSFLLAAMISFKDYIDDCLPEASEDFNKYFQAFNNTILQMCCTPLNENIDNVTALSEFTAFLMLQIEEGSIIDKNLGIDSEIGWIDRKKNKIYLKNTSGNNFYDKFTNYLKDRHEYLEISKQAFVRDVLEGNGVIKARTASKNTNAKRYDYERKILEGHDKFRVLVLDCERLKIK